jgi:hypothetical protein
MRSFVRIALLLALVYSAAQIVPAQTSSSSSQSTTQGQSQAQQTPNLSQQEQAVQERIHERMLQRREEAVREVYSHRYDAFVGMGYLRFTPGPSLQKVTLYAWDVGFTRYSNMHFGVTFDGRGYYGTTYVGLNFTNFTKPAISQYDMLVGPTYRFRLRPKTALEVQALGGYAHINTAGDTNGYGAKPLGLYSPGASFAISPAILGVYNLSPGFALRLGANDFVTGFGSSVQNAPGFTGGFVLRLGKQ